MSKAAWSERNLPETCRNRVDTGSGVADGVSIPAQIGGNGCNEACNSVGITFPVRVCQVQQYGWGKGQVTSLVTTMAEKNTASPAAVSAVSDRLPVEEGIGNGFNMPSACKPP